MKRKGLIALALTIGLVFTGCSGATSNSASKDSNSKTEVSKNYPVKIKNFTSDKKEFEVTFDKKPEKVITTNQTTTELLLDLGLEKSMIGTSYLDNPILDKLKDKYDKIPVLSAKYPTKEQVLEKNPDCIIGWKSVFTDKTLGSVESWNEKGVKTFIQRNSGVMPGSNIENVYKDIEDLGKIFDIKDTTDNYIKAIKDRISKVQDTIKDVKEPLKVLVMEGSDSNKYFAYGSNTLAGDMVEKAGGKNLAEKSVDISAENIVSLNPDVIVLIHFEAQVKDNKGTDALLNNPALQNVQAIKNKKIVPTPLAETYGGGVRTASGVENLAKAFYPEKFKN